MAVQIQLRHDTAANWTAANTVLAVGEEGVETDTGKYKLGDGVTAWNSLKYPASPSLTRVAVKTAATYTAGANELVPVDTTSNPVTVTLPNAPSASTRVAVKHIIQGGTNAVTIACAGADVFNAAGGVTTKTLPLLGQAILLDYDLATHIWTVLADDLPLADLDARYAPITGSTTYVTLARLAINPDLLIVGVITRDANEAAISAPVVWPDGATGTYTGTASTTTPGAVDAYTITHVVGGTTLTYTQPAMTRDANGAVTTRPAITVA